MAKLETDINFDLLSDAFGGIISTTAVLYGGAKLRDHEEATDLLMDIQNFVISVIDIIDPSGTLGLMTAKKAKESIAEVFKLADKEIDERADVLVN